MGWNGGGAGMCFLFCFFCFLVLVYDITKNGVYIYIYINLKVALCSDTANLLYYLVGAGSLYSVTISSALTEVVRTHFHVSMQRRELSL